MKKALLALLLSSIVYHLLSNVALAQVNIGNTFPVFKFTGIGQLVSILLSNAYVVAGIVFLFMLIIVGLTYIFNAGIENPQKIQQAHQILLWTLVGFLVILASYWIAQALEVLTGFTFFK